MLQTTQEKLRSQIEEMTVKQTKGMSAEMELLRTEMTQVVEQLVEGTVKDLKDLKENAAANQQACDFLEVRAQGLGRQVEETYRVVEAQGAGVRRLIDERVVSLSTLIAESRRVDEERVAQACPSHTQH